MINNLEIQYAQQSDYNNEEEDQEEDSDSVQNHNKSNPIQTPSRTESNFKASTNKTIERKSIDKLEQISTKNNQQKEVIRQDYENYLDAKKQTQMSYHSSKSSKTTTSMKISLLQASLNAKDQLIANLQEEIKTLKKQQAIKDQQMKELQESYEKKLNQMNQRIEDLEKMMKEKDNDIEQFKNGNQTLNLQDLSMISKNENTKQKLNEQKESLLNENFGYRQNSEIYLNSNFWLISAEKKLQNINNPVYNFPTNQQDYKQQKQYQQISKSTDKQQLLKSQIEQNKQILLPKIPEQQNLLNYQSSSSNIKQSKFLNQRSTSQQQNPIIDYKNFSSMSQAYIKQDLIPYDPDDFIVDHEIQQMFTMQSPIKKETLDWDSQPSNKYMISYHSNLNTAKVNYNDKNHNTKNNIIHRKQFSSKISNN